MTKDSATVAKNSNWKAISSKSNLSEIVNFTEYLCDSIELQVDEAHFGPGSGVVHDSPALGPRVDYDAEGGAAGDDSVSPDGVLDGQWLLLVARATVVGHFSDEPAATNRQFSNTQQLSTLSMLQPILFS